MNTCPKCGHQWPDDKRAKGGKARWAEVHFTSELDPLQNVPLGQAWVRFEVGPRQCADCLHFAQGGRPGLLIQYGGKAALGVGAAGAEIDLFTVNAGLKVGTATLAADRLDDVGGPGHGLNPTGYGGASLKKPLLAVARKLHFVQSGRRDSNSRSSWSQMTAENAYYLNDTYAIFEFDEPCNFVGTEHNYQEASAIAKYLTHERAGRKHIVYHNLPDVVRAAKSFRPEPLRYRFRDEAFRAMGIYP